jgi:hypothetical protein
MIPSTTDPFIFWKKKYLDLTDANNNQSDLSNFQKYIFFIKFGEKKLFFMSKRKEN